MGLTTEEIIKLAEMSTNIANTVTDSQQNVKELESLSQFKQWELNAKTQANEIEKNLVQEHSDELAEFNRSTTAVTTALNELELWGLTTDEIRAKLKEGIDVNTPGFAKMKGNYQNLLKENFTSEIQDASNRTERIKAIKKGYERNQSILKILDEIGDEIDQLEYHKVEAGKGLGIKGVFDAVDALDYISRNKNMFYTSATYTDPNDSTKEITKDMPNYLHRAFTKTMNTDKDIGMIDMTSANLKSRGINPTTMLPYGAISEEDRIENQNDQIIKKIDNSKDAIETQRRVDMSVKSDIVQQIQNTINGDIYQNMSKEFRIEHGLLDVSKNKISSGYLSTSMFFNEHLALPELHKLINSSALEVDKAIRGLASNEVGGFWRMIGTPFGSSAKSAEFSKIESTKGVSHRGEFLVNLFDKNKGNFLPGHNTSPLLYWAGGQGEDGELIKKALDGSWYFDDAKFESIFIDWDRDEDTKGLRLYLEEHLIKTKQLQDLTLIDPFTPGIGNVSDLSSFITDALKYKNKEITQAEWLDKIKFHTNTSQQQQ